MRQMFWFAAAFAVFTFTATAGEPSVRDDEWGKGVSFTKSWKEAISRARESGKMLFIYNGWERKGV